MVFAGYISSSSSVSAGIRPVPRRTQTCHCPRTLPTHLSRPRSLSSSPKCFLVMKRDEAKPAAPSLTDPIAVQLPAAVAKAIEKLMALEEAERVPKLNALADMLLASNLEHKQYPLSEFIQLMNNPNRKQEERAAAAAAASLKSSSIPLSTPLDLSKADQRSLFYAAFQGEWVGYEAEFDHTGGAVIRLNELDLPDEFQDWDVDPTGYECTNSTTVRTDILFRKMFRVLPSVSPLGELIDVEEETYMMDIHSKAFAAFRDGSFAHGIEKIDLESPAYFSPKKLEFGLVNPNKPEEQRILVRFGFHLGSLMFNTSPKVILESFEMNYSGGQYVVGTSGFSEGWAAAKPMDGKDVMGEWKKASSGAQICRPMLQHSPKQSLLFPEGISLQIRGQASEDGQEEYCIVELGWIPDVRTGKRSVMSQKYNTRTGDAIATHYDVETKI